MRTAFLLPLVPLAACLSAPTGRDPGDVDAAAMTWPPAGADIAAIAGGDVDGDGKDDLVVADVANDRIHLLRGGGDLDPTRPTVDTFTLGAAMPGLVAPVAVHIAAIGAARFIVVADSVVPGPRVAIFDMQLRPLSATPLSVPPQPTGALLTVGASTFGMDMNATFITTPDNLAFIEGSRIDDAVPAIMGVPPTGFADLVGASGFLEDGPPPLPKVVALEPMRTHVADVATQGNFTWTTVRDTGEAWTSQIFTDLVGNEQPPVPEVLGFFPNGAGNARLCAVDTVTPAVPNCYQTPFGMDDAALAAGPVAGPTQHDAVLLDVPPGGGNPALFLVRNLRIAAGALQADGVTPPFDVNLPFPHHAILQLDSGPPEVVVVGRDGRVVCTRAGGQSFVLCAQ